MCDAIKQVFLGKILTKYHCYSSLQSGNYNFHSTLWATAGELDKTPYAAVLHRAKKRQETSVSFHTRLHEATDADQN